MKTPFKLKYNISPLRNKLNSPLKQPHQIRERKKLDRIIGEFFGKEYPSEVPAEKSHFTVECEGGNCPTPGISDADVSTPGHQFETYENYLPVQEAHDSRKEIEEIRGTDVPVKKGLPIVERLMKLLKKET